MNPGLAIITNHILPASKNIDTSQGDSIGGNKIHRLWIWIFIIKFAESSDLRIKKQ